MAQVGQKSETWKQKRANMRASVSMRVFVEGGHAAERFTFLRFKTTSITYLKSVDSDKSKSTPGCGGSLADVDPPPTDTASVVPNGRKKPACVKSPASAPPATAAASSGPPCGARRGALDSRGLLRARDRARA